MIEMFTYAERKMSKDVQNTDIAREQGENYQNFVRI